MSVLAVSPGDIHAAAARLRGVAVRTPLLEAEPLNEIAGRRVLVKAECLQKTGSFKFRGAWNTIASLDEATRARGVVAFSSGNHAQAVAFSAKKHRIPAVIVMPADAPAAKVEATRLYGAEVILYDRVNEDREAIGQKLADERGLTLVKPFDDPRVIAGQGTAGLELAEQAASLGGGQGDVLVCCSGGGLSAGIAVALSERATELRVRSVEPEGFDDFARSLSAGTPQTNEKASGSLQDALLTPTPGKLTLPIGKALFGPGLAVSDDDALRAMALAFRWLRVVLEPGGAAALAAALFQPGQIEGEAVTVIASGGNVDPAVFARCLSLAA